MVKPKMRCLRWPYDLYFMQAINKGVVSIIFAVVNIANIYIYYISYQRKQMFLYFFKIYEIISKIIYLSNVELLRIMQNRKYDEFINRFQGKNAEMHGHIQVRRR